MGDRLIVIEWKGPYSLWNVQVMNGLSDKGLYQVYAHHPVYGRCLVYIGRAFGTFAGRIPQHQWETGSENDPCGVEYYLGRLKGDKTPSRKEWNKEIALAETLLIHAHGPAYNSASVKSPPTEENAGDIRVLNLGAVRSLHREVSGLMWTNRGSRLKEQREYGVAPFNEEALTNP